ncbi:FtsK/SpoIIIE domain-containing protein [Sulfobacillus thermosulfidooxidans]|uniref:FtsK/SpoIIIE domain-containing protein n=1 Tax=Sulfobacillus thermosulfidooxidans TaxID=28034 RepID=UPI0006B45CDE|nr:FtsK/SpoIIIE domain-containing protein [Sulfobacillus thermosulfidooxidans]
MIWAWIIFGVMLLVAWTLLASHHWVPAIPWHGAAAWQALWSPLHAPSPSKPGQPSLSGMPWRGQGVWASIEGIGLATLTGVLGLWILAGTVAWLYHTPRPVRSWQTWGDWMVWRWPVMTWALLQHHPAGITDVLRRYQQTWRGRTGDGPSGDSLYRAAARVLDAGFAQSLGDAIWMTGPDGAPLRRMTVITDAQGIHPSWPQGFDASTMQAWVQWATQWAEIALHHAGIPGDWVVNAEGVVHPRILGGDGRGLSNTMASRVPPAPSDDGDVPEDARWGAEGLPWRVLRPIARRTLPVLAGPLPSRRAEEVVQVLAQLGIPDTVAVGGQRGLALDVVEVRPTPTLAARVLSPAVASDLAGQLGHGHVPLRTHYVTGKPGVIAIERPRPDRRFVDVVTACARTPRKVRDHLIEMALPVCIGVTPDGQVVWSDAATWPHLLVGGMTGGGKTTALVAWLASLMLTVPPRDLRLTLVDPKAGSQFPWADTVPHVDATLTTPDQVVGLVGDWAEEQERRYVQFRDWGVSDLAEARRQGHRTLPYRLLVVDEYKDLKDQLDKDTLKDLERNIGRLGQKARGAGLFLWIATQHPLAETISSTLKANLPARCALSVASTSASQVILDEPGAENLLGKGDAIFRAGDGRDVVRVQTPMAPEALWEILATAWMPDANDLS